MEDRLENILNLIPGDLDRAISELKKLYELALLEKDLFMQVECLRVEAYIYFTYLNKEGDLLLKAEGLLLQCLELLSGGHEGKAGGLKAYVLNNLSVVYNKMGDYRKSYSYAQAAVKVIDGKENAPLLAATYNNMAIVLYLHLDYRAALIFFFKAHNIYEKQVIEGDVANEIFYYQLKINIGLLYLRKLDDTPVAIKHLLPSYNYLRKSQYYALLLNTAKMLLKAYLVLNQREKAVSLLEDIESIPDIQKHSLFDYYYMQFVLKEPVGEHHEELIEKMQKELRENEQYDNLIDYAVCEIELCQSRKHVSHEQRLKDAERVVGRLEMINRMKEEAKILILDEEPALMERLIAYLKAVEAKDLRLLMQERYLNVLQKSRLQENEKLATIYKIKMETEELNRSLLQKKAVNDELREINDGLSNFAARAAHDLKAPIRTMSGIANILFKKYGNLMGEEDRQLFKLIIEEGGNINRLIKDLLDFAKLGQNVPDPTPVSLNRIVSNVERMHKSDILASGATIFYKNLPTVMGNDTLYSQLFMNTIGNGIKFRKVGVSPIINVCAETMPDGNWVKVSIKDNGIGMDSSQFSEVFMPFRRGGNAQGYEGNGIGLATSKKIVELFGGNIWVESERDKGTAIRFLLPAS